MIQDNLIKECSCGKSDTFYQSSHNGIELLICNYCKTPHQYLPGWTQENVNEFYAKKYHSEEQLKIGLQEYKNRYNHDYEIANIRLEAYRPYLQLHMKGLDIGSSNSAFVHAARNQEYNFIGIDPGQTIGDDAVTIRSTIQDYDFGNEKFDFITMHDSFEHMVNVRIIMEKISSILNQEGYLIIDIPDYYVPEGKHHWRPVQHLWYWNANQMSEFIEEFQMKIVKITNPIPGKLVFYAKR